MKRITVEQTALLSLCINLAYGIYNFVTGLMTHTWWYITLGLYFTILGVIRFAVLQIKRKANDASDELFAKKFTGIMLTVLSVCLIGTVILSSVTERGVNHGIIAMITIATYAFTKVTMAKSKLVKANEKIAEAVVGGYKKIENAVVDRYTKIEDRFVDMYLTRDGETVEEAKERLKKQNNQH